MPYTFAVTSTTTYLRCTQRIFRFRSVKLYFDSRCILLKCSLNGFLHIYNGEAEKSLAFLL